MKLFVSICEIVFIFIVAAFLYLAQAANGVNEFRRCYNTSTDMHCFDAQYDNQNNQWMYTSFDDARKQCENLNSTLVIIKDEETNGIVRQFLYDPSNPIRGQYVWTDAYRINDFDKTYRWQWLNSTLPNLSASDVAYTSDSAWYVASLEFGGRSFYLRALQPYLGKSYVCEYAASNCSSTNTNARIFDGRCYIAANEQVSWYEARNRCLKGGGDLASFANVTNSNFTSWLVAGSDLQYWIGLRFARYIWKESGGDVKYANWIANYGDWNSSCLIVCFNCNPNFSWQPKDCNIFDSIYVICHTVTSLIPTTTTSTTTSTTTNTVPTITATGTTSLTPPGISLNTSSKNSSHTLMQVGVGVGVGVGVPVIIVIVLIVIYVIRRHRLKTPAQPPSIEAHPERITTDDQSHTNGGDENSQYAFVPASLSSMPPGAWEDGKPETQYAPLDFPEGDNSKNDKNHSPFDVL